MTKFKKFMRASTYYMGAILVLLGIVTHDPISVIIGVSFILESRLDDILRAIKDGKSKNIAVTVNENKMPTSRTSPLGKPLEFPVASDTKTVSGAADKPEVWREARR